LSIVDKIFKFNGGIKTDTRKTVSTSHPIKKISMPKKLILPLRQHVGRVAKLKVNLGEKVLKGQLIAEADGNVSAAIHAPTSGIIVSVEKQSIPHPSGLPDYCVTLIPDGKDTWIKKDPVNWKKIGREETIKKIYSSGIVGLGGATFPSHLKLHNNNNEIKTLVVNAAECEPYITCDDMLMREKSVDLIEGIRLVLHLLGAENAIIGIEDNKPEAIEKLTVLVKKDEHISIKVVPTIYPSGDAKRLIYLLTGTQLAKGKRSAEYGIQMFNVATIVALYNFINLGEPSISRIITITGNVTTPNNYEVLFGTPLSDLIVDAGGVIKKSSSFIMGGPMMGFKLPSVNVPVTKAMNCVINAGSEMVENNSPVLPCIRCARCADACPVTLQPQELFWFSQSNQFEKAENYNLFDCIECGCCSYVCPSNIPLVQYYRYAKSEIIGERHAKEEADIARERNDFRLHRLQREKEERARKVAERKANTSSDEKSKVIDEKRKAITEALERIKNEEVSEK